MKEQYCFTSKESKDIAYDLATKITNHMLQQNERSGEDGMCYYRSENGLKCAIGSIISDKHYTTDIEEFVCSNCHVWNAISASNPQIESMGWGDQAMLEKLFMKFQNVHDIIDVSHWKEETTKILNDICVKEDEADTTTV